MMSNRISVYMAALLIIGYAVFLGGNPAFAGTVDLPRTGQTTCSDTLGNVIPCEETCEDGDIQAGVAWIEPRFNDNGDGTVTDNLSGLMWLKDGNCFGIKKWQGALDAVDDLNANPGTYTCGGYTANYNDWVLPNVNELESLVNAEAPNSVIWLNGQGFVNIKSRHYWSSSTYAEYTVKAWVVHMNCGCMGSINKSTYLGCVWPVRAIQ